MLKIKKIKPMFNKVLTTCELYKEDVNNNGIIDASKEEGGIREYQKVIACGPYVKNVKPGDLVVINPTRYQVMKHKEGSMLDGVITDNPIIGYNFPILPINDVPYLYIYDSDIDFVIKDYEETEDSEEVVVETPEIV